MRTISEYDKATDRMISRPMTAAEEAQADHDEAEAAKPIVPDRVSMRQAKLALLNAGLYQQVNDYIEALPEPQKTAALIEWNSAACERSNALVQSLPAQFGWPAGTVEQLFIAAAQIP